MAMTNFTDKRNNELAVELGLSVKELAAFTAPGETLNYDEWLSRNVDEYEISAEELEEVIAPGVRLGNHNETLLSDAD